MSPSVQALIGKYIKSTAWNAHSEAILLSLLVGSKEDRGFDVDRILQIRKDSPDQGNTRPGLRHNPVTLNLNANSLQDNLRGTRRCCMNPT